ncbi:hypothetical protein JCM11641_005742 [Rhodosporidiobolus odoratus]
MAPLSLTAVLSVLLLIANSASAFKHSSGSNRLDSQHFVPNSYIIEVDASRSTLSKRGLTPFAVLDRTLAAVKSSGITYNVRQRFQDLPEVFHGASIKVKEGTTMEQLAKIDGVKNIWPVQLMTRPTNPSVADASPYLSSGNFTTLLSSSAFPSASAYEGETYYPHVQTGVAPLHDSGYLGKGVKVAVLDNGVDYTNPLLGGCFGEGCHISFGYAFVDDAYDGYNEPVASNDPYSSCATHGTHVTGIIGALANELGFSGVAPAATLGHYRVLGCSGSVGEDILVAGIMRAYKDGADVISMSIAGGVGWLDITPSQILAEYLGTQNVHVIAAGGNERTEGLFFTDTPAATMQGTIVGAVDPLYYPAYNATLLGRDPLPYTSPTPLSNLTGSYGLYFTSPNTSVKNDACTKLPASTPDLSNRVVVVQRGTCDFNVKLANIAAAGGKIVLVYNSAGSLAIPQLNTGNTGLSGVASLRYEDGLKLLGYSSSQPDIKISFPFTPLVPYIPDTVSGGTVSYYSNFGPTNELYMYPTLVTPGTNILSTVPGGVALMRGSSMATPYHAGAVALVLSARKGDNLTPAQVKALFMTTNTLATVDVGGASLEPVISQGSGVINVNRALAARTDFSPSQLLLNDTQYLNNVQTVTITNRNTFPVLYQFSWTNALGIVAYPNGAPVDVIPSTSPEPINTNVIRVAFGTRSVTIPAGSSADVKVTITPPNLTPANRAKFPIYSGWIQVTASGQGSGRKRVQEFTIPFFGLAARMYDMPVLDTTDVALGAFLPFLAKGQDIQTGPSTYTFADPPIAYFRLAAGTRRLNMDLVDANIDFTATVKAVTNPAARFVKRSMSHLVERATPTLYSDVPVYGRIYSPSEAPARDYLLNFDPYGVSDYEIPVNGTYTTPSGAKATAKTGTNYRVLVRALKITGNPNLSVDYESWLSPPFSFSA